MLMHDQRLELNRVHENACWIIGNSDQQEGYRMDYLKILVVQHTQHIDNATDTLADMKTLASFLAKQIAEKEAYLLENPGC